MRRRHAKIRRLWVLAGVREMPVFASTATAAAVAETGGGSAQTGAVAGGTSDGFNWSDAAIGAGIALGAAVGGAGILRVAGSRRRLAGLPH